MILALDYSHVRLDIQEMGGWDQELSDFMNHEKQFYGHKTAFDINGNNSAHNFTAYNYFIKFVTRSTNKRILVLVFVPENVTNDVIELQTFFFNNDFSFYFEFFDLKYV